MLLINSSQKVIISPQFNEHNLSVQEDGMKEAFERIVGDQFEKDVLCYSLCDGCQRRSASCSECRWQNSQRSIIEITECQQLWESMGLIDSPSDTSKKVIKVSYPLDAPVDQLYHPS